MGDHELLQWVALKQTSVCVNSECKLASKGKAPAHIMKT
jgi:hypothetical protein